MKNTSIQQLSINNISEFYTKPFHATMPIIAYSPLTKNNRLRQPEFQNNTEWPNVVSPK